MLHFRQDVSLLNGSTIWNPYPGHFDDDVGCSAGEHDVAVSLRPVLGVGWTKPRPRGPQVVTAEARLRIPVCIWCGRDPRRRVYIFRRKHAVPIAQH